ncbi:MAG: acyl carrier protein [Acidimicrobiia bacterium]|nr:acyl carrier protein [Acidimicrobiia bacterium]
MISDPLELKVVAVVTRELSVPPGSINLLSTSDDVDRWDSLGHLQICMALEAEFGVSPGLEEVGQINSVSAIIEYLRGMGI